MSPAADGPTVQVTVDAQEALDQMGQVTDGINSSMAEAGTLTEEDREIWAADWLTRQMAKPEWKRDPIPGGLTHDDINAARLRMVERDCPEIFSEIRCDRAGRVTCSFCHGPLKVVDWQAMLEVIEDVEGMMRKHEEDVTRCRLSWLAIGTVLGVTLVEVLAVLHRWLS